MVRVDDNKLMVKYQDPGSTRIRGLADSTRRGLESLSEGRVAVSELARARQSLPGS